MIDILFPSTAPVDGFGKAALVQQVADVLYRIYRIARLNPKAQTVIESYYDRHQGDYDALAYGASDCRLSRFVHNRIVPLCTHD